MHPASHHRCRLGPGANKGLLLVRPTERQGSGHCRTQRRGDGGDAARSRATSTLDWVETICECSKYEAYMYSKPGGISANKTFAPHAGVVDCFQSNRDAVRVRV